MRPTDDEKKTNILPALKKAIDSTEQRDINSSCMVAMAKIGNDDLPDGKHLEDIFLPRLKKNDQEVSETAALAFGIAATNRMEYLDVLVGLAKDDASGRTACGKSEVNDRTRSFAAYGIGLIAYYNNKYEIKEKAFGALKDLIDDKKISSRNIKVAAINAMGLLNIPTNATNAEDKGKKLVDDALECLKNYYAQNLGSGEQLLQAHAPTAIAKLLHNCSDQKLIDSFKKTFSDDLTEKARSSAPATTSSARACSPSAALPERRRREAGRPREDGRRRLRQAAARRVAQPQGRADPLLRRPRARPDRRQVGPHDAHQGVREGRQGAREAVDRDGDGRVRLREVRGAEGREELDRRRGGIRQVAA